MIVPFVKMHGCGNDFVVVNEFETFIPEEEKSKFSKHVCTYHFSVGADGVIFVRKPTNRKAEIKMQYFNADGSEGPMCGNGIRVLVKFAVEKGLVPMKKQVDVETPVGIIRTYPKYSNNKVISTRVDMGKPKIKLSDIPAVATEETMIQKKINVPSFGILEITAINTGVPHAIIFVDNVEKIDVTGIGRAVRSLTSIFPIGTNVDFVEVASPTNLKVRTYERGVEAETLACGTGICASVVASFLTNKIQPNVPITVDALGGVLKVEVSSSKGVPNRVYIEGPAEYTFKGEIAFET